MIPSFTSVRRIKYVLVLKGTCDLQVYNHELCTNGGNTVKKNSIIDTCI
jgi:hypothetical protein